MGFPRHYPRARAGHPERRLPDGRFPQPGEPRGNDHGYRKGKGDRRKPRARLRPGRRPHRPRGPRQQGRIPAPQRQPDRIDLHLLHHHPQPRTRPSQRQRIRCQDHRDLRDNQAYRRQERREVLRLLHGLQVDRQRDARARGHRALPRRRRGELRLPPRDLRARQRRRFINHADV